VDQVSRPVLIALIAAVALIGVRFTILRSNSGGGSTPAATAPGQTGLQSSIDKANNAVGVSKQSAARHEQAAAAASGDAAASASGGKAAPAKTARPAAATKSVKPAAAKTFKPAQALPKLQPGDRSGPILRDLAKGKVVVALFFNPHGADDNAALRAVRGADRHHGRVVVHSIPIGDVGNYNALTSAIQVLEAPTILVIGPSRKARTIVGYTEVREVDQAVGDIGGKAFQAKAAAHLTGWAAKASDVCQGTTFGIETSGTPTSAADIQPFLTRAIRVEHHDRSRIAAIPASGAKQVAAKRALLRAYDADIAGVSRLHSELKSGAAPGPALLALVRTESQLVKQNRPALRAVGERHCLG
jgi:hypothetical protein